MPEFNQIQKISNIETHKAQQSMMAGLHCPHVCSAQFILPLLLRLSHFHYSLKCT